MQLHFQVAAVAATLAAFLNLSIANPVPPGTTVEQLTPETRKEVAYRVCRGYLGVAEKPGCTSNNAEACSAWTAQTLPVCMDCIARPATFCYPYYKYLPYMPDILWDHGLQNIPIKTCLGSQTTGTCIGELLSLPGPQPPASQPPASQPPTSQPPASQPPASQPPTSQPPTSQPPASQPSSTPGPHSSDLPPASTNSTVAPEGSGF